MSDYILECRICKYKMKNCCIMNCRICEHEGHYCFKCNEHTPFNIISIKSIDQIKKLKEILDIDSVGWSSPKVLIDVIRREVLGENI